MFAVAVGSGFQRNGSEETLILISLRMASQESTSTHQQRPQKQRQSPEWFKYSRRVVLRSILDREDGGVGLVGERVVVGGWIKSSTEKKAKQQPTGPPKSPAVTFPVRQEPCCEILMTCMPLVRFLGKLFPRPAVVPAEKPPEEPAKAMTSATYLRINDGSCVANLQVVVDSSMSLLAQVTRTGASILVEGVLEQSSLPDKHVVDLRVEKILHVGIVDLQNYPLAKTKLSWDSIRAYPHLRPRTSAVASTSRIRSALPQFSHMFFQNNGFIYVHMPTITTTDMSASNKMFQVTTLFSKVDDRKKLSLINDREVITLDSVKAAIKEKSNRIAELSRSDSNKEALVAALRDLQKTNELALQMKDQENLSKMNATTLDFSKDFFSQRAYLSVSASLHLESYACALSSVYTIGPVFCAEDSQASKHLAEMWMVEVELAFAELEDVMICAEDFLKFLCQSILDNCSNDIKFISNKIDKNCISRLQSMISTPFARITYAEALEALKKVSDKTFETKVDWGINLSDEHERYLVDEIYKCPLIVYEFPKEAKQFYVRARRDGRTVSAFDIIAPKAGALIRGSQKEERIDMISSRIEELGLPREQYEWYLDLRRHGTVKHSGFSLGFEQMVMFVTGLDDIRDAIPFPRNYGTANA